MDSFYKEFWEVAVLGPPYKTFLYYIPKYFPKALCQIGLRVIIPFRGNFKVGILIEKKQLEIPEDKIKPVFFPLEEESILTKDYIEFIKEVSKHYVTSVAEVLSSILPHGLKKIKGKIFLKEKKIFLTFKEILKLKEDEIAKLLNLLILNEAKIISTNEEKNKEDFVVELVDLKVKVPSKNIRQKKVIDYIRTKGPQKFSFLKKNLGLWAKDVVDNLCKKGILKKVEYYEKHLFEEIEDFITVGIELNRDQKKALKYLSDDLKKGKGITLIFGVTGSGKTQVYINILKKVLESGGTGLFLIPEVALGYHIFKEVETYLKPWECYFYHSYLPKKEREKIFIEISKKNSPFVVVGTRSSIFLPHIKWKVIIIDEEHDPSYKQEERFFYNAKEIAFYLTKRAHSTLILGSATPDIKTFYSAQNGRISLIYMKKRINDVPMPDIEIVDMLNEKRVLTKKSEEALLKCIERGEQAILLLNRRGYAPIVFCTSCKKVLKCDSCSVSLTYHKEDKSLLCHYCGTSKDFPYPCPDCGSLEFLLLSGGTEKVEEYLKNIFGYEFKTLRLDRDSVKTQKDVEKVLKSFSKKEAQILIGTQMCSKGYHFPDVTLVIVLDGDVGLNLPDYRASERIFSLLVQVSGRSGRGEKKGKVLIQTRNPDHYFWDYIKNNDYEGFFQKELSLRKMFGYPPFKKLALIRMTFPENWKKGYDVVKRVREIVEDLYNKDFDILGPTYAPIKKINKKVRYHLILKSDEWSEIRKIYKLLVSKLQIEDPRFKFQLDMDPVQMV